MLSFPIDGLDELPTACRARSATSSSARRSSATSGGAARARAAASARLRPRRRDGGARARDSRSDGADERRSPRALGPPSMLESFNFAFEGIIHVLRTQRNLRLHFLDRRRRDGRRGRVRRHADRADRAAALDRVRPRRRDAQLGHRGAPSTSPTSSFDPLAKLAKDVAAGAVLIAAVNARRRRLSRLLGRTSADRSEQLPRPALERTGRPDGRRARPRRHARDRGEGDHRPGYAAAWRLPSGHAAVAFAGWMAVTFVLDGSDHRFLVSSLAFIMALLVAQTRVEAGVHSTPRGQRRRHCSVPS